MKDTTAFSLVSQAIAQQFSVDRELITVETVAADVPGWDSFSNGILIMALEDAAGRQFPFDELTEAGNVGEMIAVIEKYL